MEINLKEEEKRKRKENRKNKLVHTHNKKAKRKQLKERKIKHVGRSQNLHKTGGGQRIWAGPFKRNSAVTGTRFRANSRNESIIGNAPNPAKGYLPSLAAAKGAHAAHLPAHFLSVIFLSFISLSFFFYFLFFSILFSQFSSFLFIL